MTPHLVTITFTRGHLAYPGALRTLCGATGGRDQDWIDRTYSGCYVIADMPMCRSCRRYADPPTREAG